MICDKIHSDKNEISRLYRKKGEIKRIKVYKGEVIMKVVIAIDSLKGSLSSIEAAEVIKAGILTVNQEATVEISPLADGGEGTTEALVMGLNGEMKTVSVTGPLFETREAQIGLLPNQTAVIEMAQAAGLPFVPTDKRNPLHTTTYGVGEMIKQSIDLGYRKFVIGIGGSATTDAGIGMLAALGYQFFDAKGEAVELTGEGLGNIERIDTTNVLKELADCEFNIACDVNNPLYGLNGAAHIYGPQKGATPEIVEQLDNGLIHFSKVVAQLTGTDYATSEGAGAAGGLGFAFVAFLNGKLQSGIDIVLNETRLEEKVKTADIVITGEGRLDHQTAMGKGPIGVAKLAKKYNALVIGLAGATTEDAVACNQEGMDAYFSIVNGAMSLEDAMNKEIAAKNMKATTIQIFNLMKAVK